MGRVKKYQNAFEKVPVLKKHLRMLLNAFIDYGLIAWLHFLRKTKHAELWSRMSEMFISCSIITTWYLASLALKGTIFPMNHFLASPLLATQHSFLIINPAKESPSLSVREKIIWLWISQVLCARYVGVITDCARKWGVSTGHFGTDRVKNLPKIDLTSSEPTRQLCWLHSNQFGLIVSRVTTFYKISQR